MAEVIVSAECNLAFRSHHPKTGWLRHHLAAWKINGDKISPVLFPAVPSENRLFYEEGMSGIINVETGQHFSSPEAAAAASSK